MGKTLANSGFQLDRGYVLGEHFSNYPQSTGIDLDYTPLSYSLKPLISRFQQYLE
jgi:hypothetical protein